MAVWWWRGREASSTWRSFSSSAPAPCSLRSSKSHYLTWLLTCCVMNYYTVWILLNIAGPPAVPLRVTELFIFCVVFFVFVRVLFQFSFLSYSNCTQYFNDKRSKMDVESVCVFICFPAIRHFGHPCSPLQLQAHCRLKHLVLNFLSCPMRGKLCFCCLSTSMLTQEYNSTELLGQHNTTPFGSHSACCILLQQCQIWIIVLN